MAFSTQGPSAHDEPLAEINVTPFVDVVLVLLIIFMITAGVFDFGLEIDVPQTREVAASQQEFPFINITGDGMVFYNTEPVAVNEIASRILADFEEGPGKEPGVYLRAHKTTPWEVISPIVEQCGAEKIAVQMVTKPLESQAVPGAE